MKMGILSVLSLMFSVQGFAAFQKYECVNADSSIVITGYDVGGLGELEIKGLVRDGKEIPFKEEVLIQPEFGKGNSPATLIQAIPTANKNTVSELCETMHVIQADGEECYGRERWKIVTQENYLFAFANGNPILNKTTNKAPGMTDRGYVADQFTCTDAGITTAGGCFDKKDSRLVEWVKTACSDIK